MQAVSNETQEEAKLPGGKVERSVTSLLVMIAVTVILLVIVEAISFVGLHWLQSSVLDEHHGQRMLAAYKGQSWAPALAREEKASRAYDYKAYTIWRSKPFHGEALNVDENGMRYTAHSHCGAGQYTIWMFGGSTMRGNGSPDWGTIPSQLAEMYEKAGQPVCILNFGEGAWVNTQEVVQLELALKGGFGKPNFVVFYDGANETYVPYQSGKADVHMNFNTVSRQFESQRSVRNGSFAYLLQTNTVQLLFSMAGRAALRRGDPPVPNPDLDGLAQASVNSYFANMDTVEGLARQYGFEYTFFWQPVLYAGNKPAAGAEEQLRHIKQMTHLQAWAPKVYSLVGTRQHPHFYNLTDTFDHTQEEIFLDWCHVFMPGNQLIASRMYAVLPHARS